MTVNSFKQLLNDARKESSYLAESLKLEFVIGVNSLIKRRNISRKDLAKKFGSSPAYISKAMNGDVNFTIETMAKFVTALDGRIDLRVCAKEDSSSFMQVPLGYNDVISDFGYVNDRMFTKIAERSEKRISRDGMEKEDERRAA